MVFILNSKYKDALLDAVSPRKDNTFGPLSLFLQSQVSLSDDQVVGFEALIRWFDPDFGYINPERCIEIADFYKLTPQLNSWIVGEAVKVLTNLHPSCHIAINICANALTIDLGREILRTLLNHGCDPGRMCIEITEHQKPQNLKNLGATCAWLKRQGIKIALDDFGSGHATMEYLKYIDFDMIKLDKSYLEGLCRNTERYRILLDVVSVLNVTGADILCEGVESLEKADILKEIGISFAQGYLFGRPEPAGEFLSA